MVERLFEQKQGYSQAKNQDRAEAAMVMLIAMIKRICTDNGRQKDHKVLKWPVFNDIETKNRQTCYQ